MKKNYQSPNCITYNIHVNEQILQSSVNASGGVSATFGGNAGTTVTEGDSRDTDGLWEEDE